MGKYAPFLTPSVDEVDLSSYNRIVELGGTKAVGKLAERVRHELMKCQQIRLYYVQKRFWYLIKSENNPAV